MFLPSAEIDPASQRLEDMRGETAGIITVDIDINYRQRGAREQHVQSGCKLGHIDATKQARPDEQAALAAKAAEASGGPLFSRLCDDIDLNDDKVLTPEELRKVLKQPWLAAALSRLIIHHTSEWGMPAEQWNAIDKDIPELRKVDRDKEKEKERIQALQWWSQVKKRKLPELPRQLSQCMA